MDCIWIRDIRAYGYIGFFEAEKKLGQWFAADLKLETCLKDAAQTDNLQKTVDYGAIVHLTKQLIETAEVDLIETVAETIAQQVLQMELVNGVEVILTKLAAPIPNFHGSVSVVIHRQSNA